MHPCPALIRTNSRSSLTISRYYSKGGGNITEESPPRRVEFLSTLSDAERKVLDYSTSIGKKFDFDVLLTALASTEEDLAETLEGLVRKGVVRESPGGEEYQVTSEQILLETQKKLSSSRVRLIHKKLGEAYQALYPDPSTDVSHEMARHFYLGKVHDQSIIYNRHSAELARESFSPEVAIQFLDRVREDLSAMEGDHKLMEADVLRELGDIHSDMGDAKKADEFYKMSLDNLPGDQPTLRALTLLARADAARDMDQLTHAKEYCSMAIAEFDRAGRKKALAGAHRMLAKIAFKEGQYDVGKKEIESALTLFDVEKDAREVGECYVDLGNIFMRYNTKEDQERGKDCFRKAMKILEPINDYHQLFRAHNNIAVMAADVDPETAIKELGIAKNYAEMAKDRRSVAWTLFNTIEYLLSLGRVEEAEKNNAESEAILTGLGDQLGLQQVAMNKGILAQHRRDYARAEEGFRDSLRRAEELNYTHYAAEIHIRLAQVYEESGRNAEARSEIATVEKLGEDRILPTMMLVYRELQRKLSSMPSH